MDQVMTDGPGVIGTYRIAGSARNIASALRNGRKALPIGTSPSDWTFTVRPIPADESLYGIWATYEPTKETDNA